MKQKKINRKILKDALHTLFTIRENDTNMPISNIEICVRDSEGDGFMLDLSWNDEDSTVEKRVCEVESSIDYADEAMDVIEFEPEEDEFDMITSKRLLN